MAKKEGVDKRWGKYKKVELGLYFYPDKPGANYEIRYRDLTGKYKREFLQGVNCVEKARTALAKRRTEVHENRFYDKKVKKVTPFSTAVKSFLEHSEKHLRPSTHKNDKQFAAVWLQSEHFKKPIQEISAIDIEHFSTELSKAPSYAGRTRKDGSPYQKGQISLKRVNNNLARLRRLFRLAMRNWKMIDTVPVITMFKYDEKERYVISYEEETRLLEACDEAIRPVVALLIETGCRKEEILFLPQKEVRLEEKEIRLPSARTKGRRPRTVPLNQTAVDILKPLTTDKKPSALVFPGANGNGMRDFRAKWENARAIIGLPGLWVHDLRHTFITRAVRAGVSILVLQDIVGHKSLEVLRKYYTTSREDLQGAVERMEREKLEKVKETKIATLLQLGSTAPEAGEAEIG